MSLTLAAQIIIVFALIVTWCRIAINGGSITKKWWPIVIAAFLGWNILVPLLFYSSNYQGNVVDEDTGDPIPGAVVTVIWYDSQIIHMARTRHFQTAAETVTGNDGSFSLWNWPGISFNPFTYVLTPPETIIYKAGYAPLSVPTTYDRGYTSYEGLADALKKGIVMKLPKLRTKEEATRFADHGVGGDVPAHQFLKLIREVNIHRKTLGLTPFQVPGL